MFYCKKANLLNKRTSILKEEKNHCWEHYTCSHTLAPLRKLSSLTSILGSKNYGSTVSSHYVCLQSALEKDTDRREGTKKRERKQKPSRVCETDFEEGTEFS